MRLFPSVPVTYKVDILKARSDSRGGVQALHILTDNLHNNPLVQWLASPQTSFGVRLSRIHFSPRTSAKQSRRLRSGLFE